MKKYQSKIGTGILIFLIVVLGGLSVISLYQGAWIGVVIIGLVGVFIGYIFSSTQYVIHDQVLNIKSGFVVDISIQIETIKSISKSRNLISSPANSLDRIEIRYNQYDTVLISPQNKKAFIRNLKEVNPNIDSTDVDF
ncbi:PH domain-containing protein [Marinifilum sp. RC60d5]|uniref:PH domain-containing protein n=1 Tax=Marinifilum sp. RC60d5 TaxID=3458414 RepID=UPI0040364FE0